jgi:hypothetical protein
MEDECVFIDCEHPSRRIESFVAIVHHHGHDFVMHSDCAQMFSEANRIMRVVDACRANYRWN